MPQGTIITKSIKRIRPLKKICSCVPQYQSIRSSINQFGQICPITISENNFLLDGHNVCQAIQETGHTSVSAVQLKLRPNIQEAWELYRLLNGKPSHQENLHKDDVALYCNPHYINNHPLDHINSIIKPASDLLKAKLIAKSFETMPFALQKSMYDILSAVLH
ncbi:ParB domain-containing protein [Desulfonema limicola]|uniref:ParB domain-containing protein n=1 Tax=Desulfonema limicola TaxID=45656 RepID=A0A975B455_9BACT|nr:hypothetical protein [Desulfonema limicola]QTA78460.1 ParB domain-containing protein [Desulfonema limicola]